MGLIQILEMADGSYDSDNPTRTPHRKRKTKVSQSETNPVVPEAQQEPPIPPTLPPTPDPPSPEPEPDTTQNA
jgi:hypothetical protein